MTILTTVPYLNPFIMNDRQITNIIFYNDEGILFETHRGWFGYGNNAFKSFDLVDEVKVRRITALNKLDKKENFVVSSSIAYSNDKGYDLYLYVDGKNISLDKEEFKEENFSSTQIRKYVNRCLTIYNKKIDLEETLKFVDTDFGQEVKKTKEELSSLGIQINQYDLIKLLETYNLVKRS